jgi:tetratricopeptide (TPR) repeat protein
MPRLSAILFAASLLAFALPAGATVPAALQARIEARDPAALPAAEAHAKANARSAAAWIALAQARLQARRAEPAIEAAKKATALAPKNAQAFRWLGNAYGMRIGEVGMLGKMAVAPKLRDAFETAVRLDPTLDEVRYSLIEFYLQAPGALGGGIDKARAQAAEIGKRDVARGHLARGRIALHEEDAAAAQKAYAAALAARPRDPKVRLPVALAYQQLERWDDAFALLRAWIAEEPAAATPRYQLGRAAALSGRHADEALAALQAFLAMKRAPDEPEPKHAYWRMGQIHARAGREAEARAAWTAALKLDPKFTEAKDELAKL